MNKLKLSPLVVASVAISFMVMLTGCDKNEDVVEVWDYPWYLQPDTGRGSDGKLYFHPNDIPPENGGFLTDVTGIEVEKIQSALGECNAITSAGGSDWIVNFTFTGDRVNAYSDFAGFKDLCRQTGFRPGVRTPYDPELLKLQPIFDWSFRDDLCCTPVKSMKIITQKGYKAGFLTFGAGDDLARYVFMRTTYLDDSFAWHRQHKDRNPTYHNFIPDANFNFVCEFPVQMYNSRPLTYLMNGFTLKFRSCVPDGEKGDYPMKLIIQLANGEEFTADLLLKVK